MKTLFNRFMALFVAITMIVGCEQEHLTTSDEAQPQTLMVAAISGDPDSKTATTPNEGDALGFKVKWEVGDKLIASTGDGETYVATFEIKTASDIAADGRARFTAVDASKILTIRKTYKFYTRDRYSSDLSYNEMMTYPDSEWWSDVDDENFNVCARLHTPEPVSFDLNPIVLEYFYSYIKLTAELPSRDYDVRIRYHDVDTSTDYSYRYMTSGTSYGGTSSTFVFNAAIAPANLSASNPIIVDCSDGDEENYTELFRIESDGAFEAGKHYRIKKEAIVTPPLEGFPTGAVPVAAMKKGSDVVMADISEAGFPITDSNKAQLSTIRFFIGKYISGIGLGAKYRVFEDATWKLSGLIVSGSRPYLELNDNGDGSFTIGLLRALPTTLKTVTFIATAPDKTAIPLKVTLKGSASVTPDDAPTSVELDRSIFVANEDAVMTLSATVLPDETGINKTLNWKSSDTTVATVDANGKVTTKSGGTAIITATAAVGGEKAECIVRVNDDYVVKEMYKVGEYFPNDENPIGVVFMVNGASTIGYYGSRGKIVSLDEFRGYFSTIDDQSVVTDGQDGYGNTRGFYQSDSDFSNYPALKWVAEKNAAGCNFPSGAKNLWYLPSDQEQRHLISGMCGLVMNGTSGIYDWGRFYAMNIDDRSYTPDLTAFNKKITDKGGKAISSTNIVSSSIDHNMVFSINTDNGRVGSGRKDYNYYVRAVMEFDVSAEQYQ